MKVILILHYLVLLVFMSHVLPGWQIMSVSCLLTSPRLPLWYGEENQKKVKQWIEIKAVELLGGKKVKYNCNNNFNEKEKEV